MKTYKQFIKELKEQLDPVIKSRLVPAIRVGKKINMGKRGQTHFDMESYKPPVYSDDNGFYDPKFKKFYNRNHKDVVDLDATDLMTSTQRMRKFSTEETLE